MIKNKLVAKVITNLFLLGFLASMVSLYINLPKMINFG